MTAHSASLISDGQGRTRVLRLVPPGQHRHATAGSPAGGRVVPRHALLGAGKRLFDHLGGQTIELERTGVIESPYATHLFFTVRR